jgi:hypothetical protein
MPNQSDEWLRRMAEAEDEALAGSCGILACSPEIYKRMMEDDAVVIYRLTQKSRLSSQFLRM